MNALARASRRLGPVSLTVPLLVIVFLISAGMFWSIERTSYDVWAGLLVAICLIIIHVPALRFVLRREHDPFIVRLIAVAFLLKLMSAVARYAVAFALYDGTADASTYHNAGVELARQFRDGNFTVEGGTLGTGFIRFLTGLVYTVTGPTKLGGFFIFACAGFWGTFLLYRAFVTACPEGDRRRYALLLFFLPSLQFWPASIGKEAWITLGLGLSVWGAARMFTRRRGGFVAIVVGAAAVAFVRPHVALLITGSVFAAYLFRRAPRGSSITAPMAKIAGIGALGLLLIVVVNQNEDFFELDSFNRDAIEQTLEKAEKQSSGGDAAFDNPSEPTSFSPSRFPQATVSVLFRPFPWEAKNAQAGAASAEGIFLAIVVVGSWRRIVGALRSLVRTPYVVLCVVYGVLFIYAFSSFSNFGILTRQRVQVLPFVLVLVCLPPFVRKEQGWRSLLGASTDTPTPELSPLGR